MWSTDWGGLEKNVEAWAVDDGSRQRFYLRETLCDWWYRQSGTMVIHASNQRHFADCFYSMPAN